MPSGAIVRRRIALDQQDAEVVARLTERRLLTVSEGTVEVAHEALLREWPRLRGWLAEDAQGRRVHRALREATRAWDQDARDAGGLYRGARLAAALDWAAHHDAELEPDQRAFLDAARRAGGRAQRRLRLVLAGVAALLVVAVIAGAWRSTSAIRRATRRRRRGAATGCPGAGHRATSTARCCSRARASRSPTRRRRAATCSPHCSRARRRSVCWTSGRPADGSVSPSPDIRSR